MSQIVLVEEAKQKYTPKNPRIEDRRYYFLNDEEIQKMKEATVLFGPGLRDTYHAMLCLMLNSGLRRENVKELRVEQIDWEYRVLRIKAADIKTRISTIVPFTEETGRYLKAAIGARISGYVFLHKTVGKDSQRRYSSTQINNIVAAIGRKADIQPKEKFKNVNPHLLRHTWVKKCREAGVPKDYVKAWGGWKSTKMIDEVYGQPDVQGLSTMFKEKVNW